MKLQQLFATAVFLFCFVFWFFGFFREWVEGGGGVSLGLSGPDQLN